MKFQCCGLFTLIILNVIRSSKTFEYQKDIPGSVLGDSCKLNDNKDGICANIANCEYAKKLYRSGKRSEIIQCQFVGRDPVVCCPRSIKFQNALCLDDATTLRIENNIVSGRKAAVGEFPFQVALGYKMETDGSIDFRCGGSLIADDIVLTAAHCVTKTIDIPVTVRLGRTSIDLDDTDDDSEAIDIDIQTIKYHPMYSKRSGQNDIALIKLKESVQFTAFVQRICLSSSDNNIPEKYTITGFGRIDPSTSERSNWLLKGSINLYKFDTCKSTFEQHRKIVVESQVCAFSDSGVSSCHGDSGGPMSYEQGGRQFLYGIISYGIGCGSSYPLVYTKVNRFLEWINTEMIALE